jgi:hypothetical protein
MSDEACNEMVCGRPVLVLAPPCYSRFIEWSAKKTGDRKFSKMKRNYLGGHRKP